MNKDIRVKIIVGVISLIMGMTVTVLAGSVEPIKVTLREDYKIIFKGEELTNIETPLIHNDRTYLPLRIIAELANMEVGYELENNEDGSIKSEIITLTTK